MTNDQRKACPVCGAQIADYIVHETWHYELFQIVTRLEERLEDTHRRLELQAKRVEAMVAHLQEPA